jgi:hypothetical protein
MSRFACALALALVVVAGCATTYAYHFDVAATALEDDSIKAAVQFTDGGVQLQLQNKTDQIVQVEWNKISLDRGDGTTTRLHPSVDLGWIEPSNTAVATLVPLAFPQTGSPAAAYEGRTLQLAVPMVVRHESKTYRYLVVVHVQAR